MSRYSTLKGRTCAICGKPGGINMVTALRSLGIERRHFAHTMCVVRERRKRATREKEMKTYE